MKKLLETIEDMWIAVAFAEHDALPMVSRTGLTTETALDCLRAATHNH